MKQTIVKYTAILFLATLSSCGIDMFNRIEGNNNVISINRDINQDFTKVRVSTGIELIIDQGSETPPSSFGNSPCCAGARIYDCVSIARHFNNVSQCASPV